MISKTTIKFLKNLSENNYREWFHEHRDEYQTAKKEFEEVISLLLSGICKFDKQLVGVTPKDSIFRINRDIRFSHDKSPYKSNFGGYMVRGGRKSPYAGYYLHIEPGTYFLSGGLYIPQPPVLKEVRNFIYDYTDEFLTIINDKKFKKHFGAVEGDRIQTVPKGFPKDFEHLDLLRFKSYNVSKLLSNDDLTKKDFIERSLEVFQAMKPFNDFLNRAVDESRK